MFESRMLMSNKMRAGLTQVQLAQRLGVSPRSVSNWETGATLPAPEVWGRLTGFLPSPER